MAKATTVDDYITAVPSDRQADFKELIELIRENMPAGYEEAMTWGMPTWEIPLTAYPDTYNKKPLMYVALASGKNGMSLYLVTPYMIPGQLQKIQDGFTKAGKKLDMGKSCIRFKKPDDIDLQTIAQVIAETPPARYIEEYEKLNKK